jgi:heat shock protein HslJ
MHRSRARRKACAAALVMLAVASVVSVGIAAELGFPYDRELLLDARPMKGAKRIPGIEIGARGEATIDLWCNTVRAQLVVVDDTITILTGQKTERQCEPERMRGDEELMAALEQVTNWQFDGDVLTLRGGKSLRFRPATN